MSRPITGGLAVLGLILMSLTGQCFGALQMGFYKRKCKSTADVEEIVFSVVKARFLKDRSIAAALIRMNFHDCFVHGCDASILIDGSSSEKTSPANGSVRGYEVIDAAKAAIEKVCPRVVSCADIIAIAARAAVFLGGGKWYEVQTGRRDGRISLASDVDLPSPSLTVTSTIQAFAGKGLDVEDMVILLGGHTVGVTHCLFVQDRLYNFENTGQQDRTMNPTFAQLLKRRCPRNSNGATPIPLNSNTKNINQMDNSFYKQILGGRGVLQIDQEIALDSRTRGTVQKLAANNQDFNIEFGKAMVKMGAIEVLTGTNGEIRRSCRAIN